MDKLKYIGAVIGGVVATIAQQYALIFVCVILAICFDVVTGLIKSKVTGVGWSSAKGSAGLWKKVALLVALCFGVFMDYFIPAALNVVSITLPFDCPFGLIVGVYIVLNEGISICENLYKINPQAVPKWFAKILKDASDKISKEEKTDEGN